MWAEQGSVKRDMDEAGKSQASYDILSYLIRHPEASDTIEGIAQWWLLEQKIRNRITIIEEALRQLVAADFIFEYKGRDSRTHYRINQCKYDEIQALLKSRTDGMRR